MGKFTITRTKPRAHTWFGSITPYANGDGHYGSGWVFVPTIGYCRVYTSFCSERGGRTCIHGRYGGLGVEVEARWSCSHWSTLVRMVRKELVPVLLRELAVGGDA